MNLLSPFFHFLRSIKFSHFAKPIIILILATLVGMIFPFNLRLGTLLFSIVALMVAIRFLGIELIIYLLAITWWLPINLNIGFFVNYFPGLVFPEIVTYAGLLMLPLYHSETAQSRKSILLDPIWFFLALLILGALIASVNIQTSQGLITLRKSTLFFVSTLMVCRAILTNLKQIYRVLKIILFSSLFFNAFLLLAPFYEGTLFSKHIAYLDTARLGGVYTIPLLGSFFFSPNTIGQITGMAATLALTFILLATDNKKTKLFFWVVFGVNLISLGLSGSRGGVVSAALPMLMIILYALRTQKTGHLAIYLMLLGFLLISVFSLLSSEILTRFQFENIITSRSGLGRLALFEKGFELFTLYPFGIGYGTFLTLTDNFILSEQNIFLNAALGAGIFGLIGLTGFLVIFFWRSSLRVILGNGEARFIFWAFLATGISFLISSMLMDSNANISVYFSWLILGIIFSGISFGEPKKQVV